MALLLAAIFTVGANSRQVQPLLNDFTRIRVNNLEQKQGDNGVFAERLIDRDPASVFHSNYTYGAPGEDASKHVEPMACLVSIEARLDEPTKQSDNLYLYTQARAGTTNGHPIQFRIDGSRDGVAWDENIAMVDIPFSGKAASPGEENYSNAFHLPSGYTWLKFTCTKTNDGAIHQPGGMYYMILAEFQLYKSEIDLSSIKTNPSSVMVDEAHTVFDYNDHYRDFEFVHTHGIIDPINHNTNTLWDWCDWSKWSNGAWTGDASMLEENGVEMPDFRYINKETAPWGRVEEGNRQRTHVTERTVYAIPGQVTTLYPFSDLLTSTAYHENFVRWYDYTTDGNNKYLDFLHDPQFIARSESNGYYGSTQLTKAATENYDMYIYTVDDYKQLIDRVHNGETRITALQCADLDFGGRTDINPIGLHWKKPFRGLYDGGGHSIVNLVIDRPDSSEVGMFGHVGSATIRNLNVHSSCRFVGREFVGLVGAIDAEEYIKDESSGTLLIYNVSTHATVKASGKNAGGLLGCNKRWNSQFQVFIHNCAVLGSIEGAEESAAMCGYAGNHATIWNSYNAATVKGYDNQQSAFVRGKVCLLAQCYDVNQGNGLQTLPYAVTDSRLVTEKDGMGESNWKIGGWGYALPLVMDTPGNRSRGVYATFYCPAGETFKTQYIAADFSQTFSIPVNVDYKKKTITEPIIAFRHIFRVVNAYDIAEEVSGSVEKNEKYVSENRRTVRARAGADFQIRFEHPQPVEQDTRTTMFYKDPAGVVRRVRRSKIKVTDRDGNDRSGIFYQMADYSRPTPRNLPTGPNPLDFYDAGKSYSRMMKCDAANAHGRFTVHLVGCDENGNELKIYGSDKELILAEYIVNFVDEAGAAMTSEAEMLTDKYAHTRPATLHDLYGDPIAVVNFDEYRLFEKFPNPSDYLYRGSNIPGGTGASRKYKWPVPWENSQYAYGYDNPHDYSMYMIADHSVITPYRSGAEQGTQAENFGKGTGRFDRLFYDTEGQDRGFFYYANAASDPGVTASLNINDLCPGSTLFVSAWLAEFSTNVERENIIFNFNVVKNDGTEVTLHSFVTGYVPDNTHGRWQHVYYQFTPNLSQLNLTSEDIHSYKLVLENNCLSSAGADYAIDDIRVYVAKPRVYAYQTMPLCRNEQGTEVRVETPFDVMLATLGIGEANTAADGYEIDCFYTFLDKEKYNQALNDGLSGEEAYAKAVVKYEYMKGQGAQQTYGRVTFNTHYRSNPEYDENNKEVGSQAFRSTIENDRYLVINTKPQDRDLIAGKEYIVALYLYERESDGSSIEPGASHFDLGSKCCKSSEFRIHASGIVKVDGIAVPDLDNIVVCENQTPVVQVEVQALDENGQLVDVPEADVLDWWDGSMTSYLDQTDPATGLPLYTVMANFRKEYPNATTWDVPATGEYTEDMRNYLESLATVPEGTDPNSDIVPRLMINKSSFVFRPIKLEANTDTAHIYVVAIPIDRETQDKYLVCMHPQEIRLTVRNNSPELNHGLAIDYPNWIDDVPLRVGLRQLRSVSAASIDADNAQTAQLTIPVRKVEVVTDGVTALERIGEDPYIYLAETDDPEYLDLNLETDDEGNPIGLYAIGRMYEIKAEAASGASGNRLCMVFDRNFNFKEGRYYRLKFSFRENGVASLPTGDNGEGLVRHCHGQHVFSLKVVPEYQAWIGADGSNNWSNDANWRRVSTSDLLHTADGADADYNDFVTDRAELTSTTNSFVPMDFTKVIVPAGVEVPELYAPMAADIREVTIDGETFKWAASLTAPEGISAATRDIQYDMAARERNNGLACRPWYTNTCDQIHFHSNAELAGQDLLTHNRAWVDFEIEPAMWYTLSLPISGVVAGDMYLPTDGVRQTTELFKPITFDKAINDRFAPAVYQRSWNTARATVYELGGDNQGVNVAVRTTWSNVYNDVDVDYSQAGSGFSVKADVSEAKVEDDVEHVMFRLPKDDTSFLYYDHSGTQTGHNTPITRSAAKLHQSQTGEISVTVQGAEAGKYFLIGNPYMAHLDMAAFLEGNAGVINAKYWILNSEGQGAAIYDGASFENSTLANADYIAPMQGFFVETKAAVKSVTLKFRSEWTKAEKHDPEGGNFLRTPALREGEHASRASGEPSLRITALSEDGRAMSQAVISINGDASDAYDEAEDVALLLDSHQQALTRVYTIAGNMAATVNTLPSLRSTELGVLATAGEHTTLRFDGSSALDGAQLYDAATGETMPITEGMEYTIEGSASSRLYIVTAIEESLDCDMIRVDINQQTVTVTAPDNGGGIAVNVFDTIGRLVHSADASTNSVSFDLPAGVYVLDARTDEVEPLRRKILIK